MLVIGIYGLKGGCGKTTVAVNLGSALQAIEGRKVVIGDLDPQGSGSEWRQNGSDIPPVLALSYETLVRDSDGQRRRLDSVVRSAGGADYVVLDAPPYLDREARALLVASDLVILPVAPTPPEIRAVRKSLELLEEARRHARPDLKACFLPNRVDGRTSAAQEIRKALELFRLPVLRSEFAYLQDFAKSSVEGKSVIGWEPGGAASEQARALAKEVVRLLKHG